MNAAVLLFALVVGEDGLPPSNQPLPPTPRPKTILGDDYDAAYKQAVKDGVPLIVWVGQKPRSLDGCVSVYQAAFPDLEGRGVVIGVVRGGALIRLKDLTGTPTDRQIHEVLHPSPKQSSLLLEGVKVASPVTVGGPARFSRSC